MLRQTQHERAQDGPKVETGWTVSNSGRALPHGTSRGLLGTFRGAFFLHGLDRFFLGLLLTVHALAHRFTPLVVEIVILPAKRANRQQQPSAVCVGMHAAGAFGMSRKLTYLKAVYNYMAFR